MQYITGADRTQAVLFPQSLDEIIGQDNEVRIIDLFVESVNLAEFKFHLKSSAEGRPPFRAHTGACQLYRVKNKR